MLKHAADISTTDQTILKGILDGFGEVLDLTKVEKFNSEVKKIFASIKQDSEGLADESLYQIAFHMARNRGQALALKKAKDAPKEAPPAEFKQPIIKRKPKSDAPTEESSLPEMSLEEPTESKENVIRRAIFDGFDFVGNLSQATTIEHIDHEAKKLYTWYVTKSSDRTSNHDLYEAVFRAAKKKAEEIIAAHQVLQDQETRVEQRIKKKEDAEKAEIERQRISEVAKLELKELIAKMLEEKELSNVSKEALRYFKLIYLDNKKDPEVVHLFPGTSRDQRYKWKERAVSMIAPYASEDSRKYIGEKTKRKYASVNVLLKAAQLFLMRCQEG